MRDGNRTARRAWMDETDNGEAGMLIYGDKKEGQTLHTSFSS